MRTYSDSDRSTSPDISPRSGSPSFGVVSSSSGSSPRRYQYDDNDDDDGSDDDGSDDQSAASDASNGTERPSPASTGYTARTHTGTSVLSASDARESIDSFLSAPQEFMGDAFNKLRLWQSLCIEFGLVELEGTVPPSLPDIPSASVSATSASSASSSSSSSRSSTPRPSLPPLPTSLTQARLLLKRSAHINIQEYVTARADPARHSGAGTGVAETAGKYADLVYASPTALARATRKHRMYYPLDASKREWLEPLLKNWGIRRRRAVDY